MIYTLSELTQIPGAGRGKSLTVPTLNFPTKDIDVSLDFGVYAGTIEVLGKIYTVAIHYGPIPTFQDEIPRLEANIIDEMGISFPPDTQFSLTFYEKIRDIRVFDTSESLKQQILSDIEKIREIIMKK